MNVRLCSAVFSGFNLCVGVQKDWHLLQFKGVEYSLFGLVYMRYDTKTKFSYENY